MAEVEAGELIVKGVPADEADADLDPMPQIEPACHFCDYRPLCGAPSRWRSLMNDHVGPISVVSAGAGTGKTWRLSTEYVQAAQTETSPART